MADFVARTEEEFDLQPDPRILPMLGEMSLDQWRCLAEFVDNSADRFIGRQTRSPPGTPGACSSIVAVASYRTDRDTADAVAVLVLAPYGPAGSLGLSCSE